MYHAGMRLFHNIIIRPQTLQRIFTLSLTYPNAAQGIHIHPLVGILHPDLPHTIARTVIAHLYVVHVDSLRRGSRHAELQPHKTVYV